jgi:hypothetical protein
MKLSIIVNLQVEGLHKWEDAATFEPKVGFLSNLHRHMFHITAEKRVYHGDREIEIILFKRKIIQYLNDLYYDDKWGCLNFENMSCESIASELFTVFDLVACKVLEDGESGANVCL